MDRVFQPRLSFAFGDPALHTECQGINDIGVCISHVGGFLRILDHVVKLNRRLEVEIWLQCADEFPLRCSPTVLTHPRALGDVDLGFVRGYFALNHSHQTPTIEINTAVDFCEFKKCGHEVFMLVVSADASSGWHFRRIPNYQWHMQIRVIQPMVVKPALVLVQRLAMIGVQHDYRVI